VSLKKSTSLAQYMRKLHTCFIFIILLTHIKAIACCIFTFKYDEVRKNALNIPFCQDTFHVRTYTITPGLEPKSKYCIKMPNFESKAYYELFSESLYL
jgi:hypothetical protein